MIKPLIFVFGCALVVFLLCTAIDKTWARQEDRWEVEMTLTKAEYRDFKGLRDTKPRITEQTEFPVTLTVIYAGEPIEGSSPCNWHKYMAIMPIGLIVGLGVFVLVGLWFFLREQSHVAT